MAATKTYILQESDVIKREGLYPCKVLALNLGSNPENPYGHYATAVKVYPRNGEPHIVPYTYHHFQSLSRAYRDYEQRLKTFGG